MATLAALKTRIADELHRSDLTSAVSNAISDAVQLYQSKRFRFNEAQGTFSTTAGTEYYGSAVIPADIAEIDTLTLTVSGRKVVLTPRAFDVMEVISSTTNSRGQPSEWCWYSDQVRLYPVPDAVYSLSVSYLKRLPVPATDAASNAWTVDGFNLIRHTAKRMVSADLVQDFEMAQAAGASEQQELRRLLREGRILTQGGLRANW